MRRAFILLICGLVFTAGLALPASGVDGKWTAQVPGFQGDTFELTFNFKAEGEKLTGSISTPMGENPISEGKISGNDISFLLVVGPPDGERKFKITYKGKLSGDEIKFVQTFEGGPGGEGFPPVEYVAKRVK